MGGDKDDEIASFCNVVLVAIIDIIKAVLLVSFQCSPSPFRYIVMVMQ